MAHLAQKIVPLLEELFAKAEGDDVVFSERQLSEQLGVSRPVVREALSGLRQRGLVEILPGKGVRPLSDLRAPTVSAVQNFMERSDIRRAEIRAARMLLEPEIAALAAANRTEEQLQRIGEHLEAMRAHIDDIPRFENADFPFHVELARASGNSLYLLWLQPITGYLQSMASRISTLGEVRHNAIAAHANIFTAVKNKDPEAARAAMVAHLEDYAQNAVKAIALGILPPEPEGDSKT